VTEREFDPLGRLTQVLQSGMAAEKRADYTYRDNSQLATITRYSDLEGTEEVATSTYGYDNMGRLTSLGHVFAQTLDYSWEYDAASRISGMTFPDDDSGQFSYDPTNQLTAADYDVQDDEGYSYDSNGNRTNTGYVTGDYNRLTSDGTFNYAYDDEGNRTTRRRISQDPADDYVTEYHWDHRNRLTKLTFKDNEDQVTQVVEYAYDSMDQLLRRTVDSQEVAKYVYDGGRIALEFNSDDDLTHRYLWNEAVDQVLADEPAVGDLLWALSDHEGTVRDLIDSLGNVELHRRYDAFGQITDSSTQLVHHFAFAGQYLDELTGLQLHGLRWYDPPAGRFASEDPSGLTPDSNPYRYARNSPLVNVDPSGLCYTGFYGELVDPFSGMVFGGRSLPSGASTAANAGPSGLSFADQWAWLEQDAYAKPAMGSSAAPRAPQVRTVGEQSVAGGALYGLMVGLGYVGQLNWALFRGAGLTGPIEPYLKDSDEALAQAWGRTFNKNDPMGIATQYAGTIGVRSAQAAFAADGVGAIAGATLPASWAATASATVNSPFVAVPTSTALAYTGYEYGRASYYSAQVGDYNASAEYAANSVISFAFAGDVAANTRWPVQTRTQVLTPPSATNLRVATTWQEHQSLVGQSLRANDPGAQIYDEINLRVTGPDGWTVKIRPDYLRQTPMGWEINDAKFSQTSNLADPGTSLLAHLRGRQATAFPWVANGQTTSVVPFGKNAWNAGFVPDRPITISPNVQIHVNGPNGVVVRQFVP